MEDLIEQIPVSRRVDHGKNTAGFTLYYSSEKGKWFCGYGRKFKKNDVNLEMYVGWGYTAIEALDDFVSNKLKNHKHLSDK